MADAGIRVNGVFYRIPGSLRIGETRMIKQITGLNPPEFMRAVGDLKETQDPDIGAALLWWAIHRQNPEFTLAEIDGLEWSDVTGESGDSPAVDPKAGAATSGSSPSSAETSRPNEEPNLVTVGSTTPANGGGPTSELSDPPTWPI